MKKFFILFLSIIIFSFSACQKAAEPSYAINEDIIIQNASKYFKQMRSGDFETIYNDLPDGVKKQTNSTQTIQASWDKAVAKAGGLPKDSEPKVSCYRPKQTNQIRVEFVIPCEKGNFKVFINYNSNGSLYNYVIFKNS